MNQKESNNRLYPLITMVLILFAFVLKLSIAPAPSNRSRRDLANQNSSYDRNRINSIRKIPSAFSSNRVLIDLHDIPDSRSRTSSITNRRTNFTKQNLMLDRDTTLLAVVDQDCLTQAQSSNAHGSIHLSQRIQSERFRSRAGYTTRFLTIPFRLDQEMSVAALEIQAENDICLKGISLEGRVTKNSLYDDPFSKFQKQNAALSVQNAEPYFYESSQAIGNDTVIAVIDTGVDYRHYDLENQLWRDPATGHIGYDFVNDDFDPFDDDGHGTHVSGLAIAEGGNAIGLSGIAPKGVRLMSIKVLDSSGAGTFSDLANGIRYAADLGAHVINLSLSGPGTSAVIRDALIYAVNSGVVVVVAAGNDAVRIDSGSNAVVPASIAASLDGVISVGSVDSETFELSYFSNYSNQFVELGSPGANGIYSTVVNNAYAAFQGTSMAAPIVAGAISLMVASLRTQRILYSPSAIENLIAQNATVVPELSTTIKGGRVVNLELAKNALLREYIVTSDGGLDSSL